MSANTPPPSGKGATPSSRRDRRLASRQAGQASARPGATGSAGSRGRTLMIWTVVGLIVGVVVIALAVYLTGRSGNDVVTSRPVAPAAVTPADIPASGRTLGNARARVTIDVYEDFRCTGCAAFRAEIEPLLETRFISTGEARLVFHDFLTIDREGNTESRDAANAALCAADQNRFWPMHDWLFANQSPYEQPGYFTPDRLVAIGQAAGMDMRTFESCVRNGTHDREIAAEQAAARNRITYTPSIFVAGALVTNPTDARAIPTAEQIGAVIERALQQSPGPPAGGTTSPTGATAAPARPAR